MTFDIDRPYRLSPSVALRPEPFGALAYHFGNRRLAFLKTPQLVSIVRSLGDHDTVAEALDAAGVPAEQHAHYAAALAALVKSEVIDARQGGCMAAKFFTCRSPGPTPECVLGHGERALATVCLPDRPQVGPDHSRKVFVPIGTASRGGTARGDAEAERDCWTA